MPNRPADNDRPLRHTDAYANALAQTDTREVNITYNASSNQASNDAAQDPDPVEYSHPIDDPSDLPHTAHLDAQFRHALTTTATPPTITATDTNAFDAVLLCVAPRALADQGTSFDDLPIATPRAKALFVYAARDMNSILALRRHATRRDDTAQLFGWADADDVPSADRFYPAVDTLADANHMTAIETAARCAIQALYRNAIQFPADVAAAYNFDTLQHDLAAYHIPEATRQEALRNWVRELLPLVEDALTFNRGRNTSYSLRSSSACSRNQLSRMPASTTPPEPLPGTTTSTKFQAGTASGTKS